MFSTVVNVQSEMEGEENLDLVKGWVQIKGEVRSGIKFQMIT